jgi:hypothetical protein
MEHQEAYSWHDAYVSALMELDRAKLHGRILGASAAIKERLLSPIEADSAEYNAIVAAEMALLTLRSEWFTGRSKVERSAASFSKGTLSP